MARFPDSVWQFDRDLEKALAARPPARALGFRLAVFGAVRDDHRLDIKVQIGRRRALALGFFGAVGGLFGVTIGMPVLPKLLALAATLRRPAERESFGGSRALLTSAFLEQLFSMLTAPAMMLFHSRFVASILLGIGVGWGPQTRDDTGVSLAEALKSQGSHMVIGAVWGGLVLALAPQFFWWLLPVVFGKVFAVPLTVLSSRISAGRAAARLGLFLTPDEIDPPKELRDLRAAMADKADPIGDAAALARTARLRYGPEVMAARSAFRVQRPASARAATAGVYWRPPATYPEHRPCEMVPQRFEYLSLRVLVRAS